jgi:hypothetical protein
MTGNIENICTLYGLFGGLLGSLCMGWLCFPTPPSQATLAIIDLQGLISKEQGALPSKSHARMVEQLAKSLGQDLEIFAKDHGLILLQKGTVVGGDIADKTAAFLAWLEAKKQGEPS